MKITVFGAGAIGSLVGGLLSTQHDVTLVSRPLHVEAIKRSGLSVRGRIEANYRPRAVTDVRGSEEQDLVIVTTKAYDSKTAAIEIEPLVGKDTIVVSLQNGMRNLDIFSEAFGDRAVIALTSMGVTFDGPGMITLAGEGGTVVGQPDGGTEKAATIVRSLEASGMAARVSEDIRAEVWMKVLVNASINPITALTGRRNGSIVECDQLRDLANIAVREGVIAAEKNGISLPCQDPVGLMLDVASRTRNNRSSMLQDVSSGRRTEIDEITGALVLAGESKGVPMPINRCLWTLVRSKACDGTRN